MKTTLNRMTGLFSLFVDIIERFLMSVSNCTSSI